MPGLTEASVCKELRAFEVAYAADDAAGDGEAECLARGCAEDEELAAERGGFGAYRQARQSLLGEAHEADQRDIMFARDADREAAVVGAVVGLDGETLGANDVRGGEHEAVGG